MNPEIREISLPVNQSRISLDPHPEDDTEIGVVDAVRGAEPPLWIKPEVGNRAVVAVRVRHR